MNTAEIKCVRVVAMATNFGIKIVINWLYENDSIIAPRQLLMEGGFEWSADRILPVPCYHGNPFLAFDRL